MEDLDGGILISTAVPLLHYPVGELLAGRSHDVGLVRGQSTGTVDIDVGLGSRTGAAVEIIADCDAGGALQSGVPPGVDVILLGYPETVAFLVTIVIIWIVRVEVAVLVEYIGVFGVHVIRRRDCIIIHHDRTTIEDLCAGFVAEPALEHEAVQKTGRGADLSAVADTEVHILITAPVDIAGGTVRIVRMQEDTILDLPPLGEDSYIALWHLFIFKRIGLSAGAVDIPALENVAFRNVICYRFEAVVAGNISTVSDARSNLELALVNLIDRVAVAVYISAVHEVDLVGHTLVIAIDLRSSAGTPGIVWRIAILLEASNFNVVFRLGEESIVGRHVLVQDKCLSVILDSLICFVRKCFDIIVDVLRGICRGVQTERDAFRRHDIDVDQHISVRAAVLRLPTLAMVIGHAIATDDREIVANALLIQPCNGFDGLPAFIV